MPAEVWERAEAAMAQADVVLAVGTSGSVWPAAGLLVAASQRDTPIIVVNAHPSEASAVATLELIGEAGTIIPKLLD